VESVKDQVRLALGEVMDPHMNVSLFDMGMIRRLDLSEDGSLVVGMVFPCIGCPAWDMIHHDIQEKASSVAGVRSVKVRIEWDELWNRSDMSDAAKERAATYGYVA
jgi:metal-sulfur cluster biosynthetic enzyme